MKKALKNLFNMLGGMVFIASLLLNVLIFTGADTSLLFPHLTMSAPSIPTFVEIQTLLVNRGYDIGDTGVDGKMCEGWNDPNHSNTLTAWDRAICDQHAERYFSGGDK